LLAPAAVRTDLGCIASAAVASSAGAINQASVWGPVATGAAAPQVDTQGTIRSADAPATLAVDPRRVSTGFNADFPAVSAPLTGTTLAALGTTLGTAGTVTRWRALAITLNGNQSLTILGQVYLVVIAGSGTPAIDVTGNATITIPAGSSLAVWVEGNMKVAGRGPSNGHVQPGTRQISGTNTTQIGQDMQIAGNGALKAVLYAPFGDVKINGNGDVMGSIVARTITLAGNAASRYANRCATSIPAPPSRSRNGANSPPPPTTRPGPRSSRPFNVTSPNSIQAVEGGADFQAPHFVTADRADSQSEERFVKRYGGDQASPTTTLARYLLNLALCESLYSPLQLCEVALRNSLHQHLAHFVGREDWFDAPAFPLTPWAVEEVRKAKDKISRTHPVTAGRVIAELQLGFWTSLFEAHYEQRTRFLPMGIKAVFPRLPKSRHNRKELKRTLEEIRALRNRVFHHERILHWTDLDAKHAAILDVIGWVSPELHEMARALDRFTAIRREGLLPWIAKLGTHWPHQA
jgi:hypothetical protein